MFWAGVKINAPQKKNLRLQPDKNCAPPLKRRPSTIVFGLLEGGGVQTVLFWSNLRPSYCAITGRGPAGPPLATALFLSQIIIFLIPTFAKAKNELLKFSKIKCIREKKIQIQFNLLQTDTLVHLSSIFENNFVLDVKFEQNKILISEFFFLKPITDF
jgi:hypothetical protein